MREVKPAAWGWRGAVRGSIVFCSSLTLMLRADLLQRVSLCPISLLVDWKRCFDHTNLQNIVAEGLKRKFPPGLLVLAFPVHFGRQVIMAEGMRVQTTLNRCRCVSIQRGRLKKGLRRASSLSATPWVSRSNLSKDMLSRLLLGDTKLMLTSFRVQLAKQALISKKHVCVQPVYRLFAEQACRHCVRLASTAS